MTGAGPLGGDWGSGERVFAPPSGTLDADWLVPAVVEAVPGTTPARARAALADAWAQALAAARETGRPLDGAVGALAVREGEAPEDPLAAAARAAVADGVRLFRAEAGQSSSALPSTTVQGRTDQDATRPSHT